MRSWSSLALLAACSGVASAANSTTQAAAPSVVDSTVLIVARDDNDVKAASPGLDAYGIPWAKALIPQNGAALPALNSSLTKGNYGSLIVIGSLSYKYDTGYRSALTQDQWNQLYTYQSDFHVRMVRLDEYPGPLFGSTPANIDDPGCCGDSQEQKISFTDASAFPGANIKTNAPVSMKGLYHYPAKIVDANTTKAIATFEPSGNFKDKTVAAVISTFGAREQMAWFTSLAPEWSLTSSYLQHAYIHWMTRSLFVGKRKIHINAQVDDLQIATELYYPKGPDFQIVTEDLDAHAEWQKSINKRLNPGSEFWLELGHNGNGNVINSTLSPNADGICTPDEAIYYDMPEGTPLEYVKPAGTGVDVWPTGSEKYNWTNKCTEIGKFGSWFRKPENLNNFAHLSHTFTHEEMNNATYHDAAREIQYNQAWMKQIGIDQAKHFSVNGLIPPAITGVRNGDVIRAWMDNGIKYVVGDNTRPVLRNSKSKYWPLMSNKETNGADGLWIVPRFSTTIYFNCAIHDCILKEWFAISKRNGTWDDLLADALQVNLKYIMDLQADPYMFHQANMHQTTMDVQTIGPETRKMSLIMSWMETITQELTRLTNWPTTSLKHDDIGKYFVNRITLDACGAQSSYQYAADGKSITGIVVSTKDNTCGAPVPVTLPTGSSNPSISNGESSADRVGSEPPIIWVTMKGQPVTLKLAKPIQL